MSDLPGAPPDPPKRSASESRVSNRELQQALDAIATHPSKAAAARSLGWAISTLKAREVLAYRRGLQLSEGARGVVQAAGLSGSEARGGWLHSYDADGKKIGATYWKAPEVSSEDIRDTLQEALEDLAPLSPIDPPVSASTDLCNIIPVADLHMGGEYGRPEYEIECKDTMDRVMGALPTVAKSFVIDLGDTTDANDHLGVTPASKNPVDVVRHGMLATVWAAARFLKHTIYRALERSLEVEVHILRGNHSETSYIAILIALVEHFRENPRVKVVVPGDPDHIRLLSWGQCGVLVDHGDKMKWADLKDTWTALEPDHWAASKAYRAIYTAHFHHERSKDLAGVECRHFRTMAAPSHWAKTRFPPMPRGTSAVTLHRDEGFEGMVYKKLRPVLAGGRTP